MADAAPAPIPLAELPMGAAGRISAVAGGRELSRRLLGLGLRVGSVIRVLHHRGAGLVVACGDARVALGGGIVERLWVEPLPEDQAPLA